MHSQEKKNIYASLYKDITINQEKIKKDLVWLEEKMNQIYSLEPELKKG